MRFDELLASARAAKPGPDLAERVIPLIDLTSLSGDETPEQLSKLCQQARQHKVAAICVYPQFLADCTRMLDGTDIESATVVNFPQGGDDILAAVETTSAAIAKGATEIDLVAPYQAALDGDIGLTGEMVEAVKEVCGARIALKVILETGAFDDAASMTAIARAAVMAGCDMLKTSTGKIEQGASLEAAAVLLSVIGEAEGRVGLKLSGGIRTPQDAASYLCLIDETMGCEWVAPDHVRFGASSLLAALQTG